MNASYVVFRLTLVVAAALIYGVAMTSWATETHVQIEGYGLYEFKKLTMVDDANQAGGRRGVISPHVIQLKATDQVRLQKGVSFGVQLFVQAPPGVDAVAIRRIIRFPSPGLRDPNTRQVFESQETSATLPVRQTLPFIYSFDEDWELVPGEWKFEFWVEGVKVAEKTFTVKRYGWGLADAARIWQYVVENALLLLVVALLVLVGVGALVSIVYGIQVQRSLKGKHTFMPGRMHF